MRAHRRSDRLRLRLPKRRDRLINNLRKIPGTALAKDHTARAALVGVLVGSVLTGATSYGITVKTIDAQKESQAAEFNEEKSREIRDKRTDVYEEFIAATASWVYARSYFSVCNSCVSSDEIVKTSNAFRASLSNVHVYGSADAFSAANAVGLAIPDTFPGNGAPIMAHPDTPFDHELYAYRHGQFTTVMCRELTEKGEECDR